MSKNLKWLAYGYALRFGFYLISCKWVCSRAGGLLLAMRANKVAALAPKRALREILEAISTKP